MTENLDFANKEVKNIYEKILKSVLNNDPFKLTLNTDRPGRSETSKDPLTPTSRISKSPSSSLSHSTTSVVSVYTRMQAFQKRHEIEIKKLQSREEEKHRLTYTHTPTLDTKSRKMVSHLSPIQCRYKKEQEERVKKLENLAKKAEASKQEEEKKDLTFSPVINRSSVNQRTPEEFYRYTTSWKEGRNQEKDKERVENDEKNKGEVTFKPKINRNSCALAKGLPKFEERLEKDIGNWKKSREKERVKTEVKVNAKKMAVGQGIEKTQTNHRRVVSSINENS